MDVKKKTEYLLDYITCCKHNSSSLVENFYPLVYHAFIFKNTLLFKYTHKYFPFRMQCRRFLCVGIAFEIPNLGGVIQW